MVEPTPHIKGVISPNALHRVTFTGCTKYFDHLENFFTTFGSTIECLSINIDLMYYIIDGKRFELGVLEKMPYLSSLDLIIHSTAAYCDPIDIETFRSLTWQKFNPVVYWNDIHAHQHTIFTLPYKSDRVKDDFNRIKLINILFLVQTSFERFSFILCIKSTSFFLF
jgi:hypothetical protein